MYVLAPGSAVVFAPPCVDDCGGISYTLLVLGLASHDTVDMAEIHAAYSSTTSGCGKPRCLLVSTDRGIVEIVKKDVQTYRGFN